MYFLMDFAPHGDLYSYISKRGVLKDIEARFIAAEILNILCYLTE